MKSLIVLLVAGLFTVGVLGTGTAWAQAAKPAAPAKTETPATPASDMNQPLGHAVGNALESLIDHISYGRRFPPAALGIMYFSHRKSSIGGMAGVDDAKEILTAILKVRSGAGSIRHTAANFRQPKTARNLLRTVKHEHFPASRIL